MKPYLFGELLALVIGVWLMVVAFVVYGWLLLKRQKQMFNQIVDQLLKGQGTPATLPEAKPEEVVTEIPPKPETTEPVRLEISRDEPLSKYENFVPDENVDVSFVDKKE